MMWFAGSLDSTVRLWSVTKSEIIHVLEGHVGTVQCVQLCGDRVVSGGDDKSLRVWSVKYGHCIFLKRRHASPVMKLHPFPPNPSTSSSTSGACVVSAGEDGAMYLWCLEAEALVRSVQEPHKDRVRAMANVRGLLVTTSVDKTAAVYAW